jgi:hypothetical protein
MLTGGLYRHYGVYAGSGTVIDLSPEEDITSLSEKGKALVHEKSLAEFLNGCPGGVDNSPGIHFRRKTLKRARAGIGSGRNTYDLLINNSEHKTRQWQTGTGYSTQVKKAAAFADGIFNKTGRVKTCLYLPVFVLVFTLLLK